MRKCNFLLAGLLLMWLPAFAQPSSSDGPAFDDQNDARLIFYEDFEQTWDEWTNTTVDVIDRLEYYNHMGDAIGQFKIWLYPEEWQRGLFRDTLIALKNRVETTDDPTELSIDAYGNDQYGFVTDYQELSYLRTFGQDGGNSYFRYVSGDYTGSNTTSSHSSGYSTNYRRYLSIPGIPIQEENSYRITLYVKANKVPGQDYNEPKPRMYVNLMRGAGCCEKPIAMGFEDSNRFNTFEYTKDDFTGEWEKVSLMAYCQNDSIAENYFYADGFWWAADSYQTWTWPAEYNGMPYDLNYIVQPDKYFVRLSFSSDYTEFLVDNLSVTRSWIGGVDFYSNMIRVNFGYQTNLADLVRQANVPAISVPYEYVTVWAQSSNDSWEEVPLSACEYHEDGYMYLFTNNYVDPDTGDIYSHSLNFYKQVLVSFRNPENPALQLKYTGNLYPKANDAEWVEAGKIVPDFSNEEGTYNANAFVGVHSLLDLPPYLVSAEYEDGSFGLNSNTNSLSFKFTRPVDIDQKGEVSSKLIAYVGNEVWTPSWNDYDSTLTITRPMSYTSPLYGDYEINLIQIKGLGTDYGESVVMHYHFGPFDTNPQIVPYASSDWRSELQNYDEANGALPASIYIHDAQTEFQQGTGEQTSAKSRLYVLDYEQGDPDNCGFYLANRTSTEGTGNLYTVISFEQPGNFRLKFKATNWNATAWGSSATCNADVYFYALPYGELSDGNDGGFELLESVANKTHLGSIKASTKVTYSSIQGKTSGKWPEGVETFEYVFNVPAQGDYVIEWVVSSGNTAGLLIGNYTVTDFGDLSVASVLKLNNAVSEIESSFVGYDSDYYGPAYQALESAISHANSFVGNTPGQYDDEVNALESAYAVFMDRVSVVDEYIAIITERDNQLYSYSDDLSGNVLWNTASMKIGNAWNIDFSTKSNDELVEIEYDVVAACDLFMEYANAVEKFNGLLSRANNLIVLAENPEWDEYSTLQTTYQAYTDFDYLVASTSEMLQANAALKAAADKYEFKADIIEAKTVRIKALASLAESLDVSFDSETDFYGLAESAIEDDDNLADIFKAAIKVALYEQILDGDTEMVELTPFIKNYNLYVTPKVVDRSGYIMPTDRYYLRQPDESGAQIQLVSHQYNRTADDQPLPIWILITNQDFDDLYPGWSVRSYDSSSGMLMVTPDNQDYTNFIEGRPVFDGQLSMDWNSSASLSTQLYDLPVGVYSIGVDVESNSSTSSNMLVVTDGDVYSYDIGSITEPIVAQINDVPVYNGQLSINLNLQSQSGWSYADNFNMSFSMADGYDYDNALYEANTELAILLKEYAIGPDIPDTVVIVEPVTEDTILADAKAYLYRVIDDAQAILASAGQYHKYKGAAHDSVYYNVERDINFASEFAEDYYQKAEMLAGYILDFDERISLINYLDSILNITNNTLSDYEEFYDSEEYLAVALLHDEELFWNYIVKDSNEIEDYINDLTDALDALLVLVASNPTEQDYPNSNEIWYTTTDGEIVTPAVERPVVGATLVSNTYENGKGVMTFDAPVVEIDRQGFYNCRTLETVILPEGCTDLNDDAFQHCDSLKAITLPSTLKFISSMALYGCEKLEEITIPDSVVYIGRYAFCYCYLLEEVTIPESVRSIGGGAFSNCLGLSRFNGKFADESGRYLIDRNILLAVAPYGWTTITVPDGITKIMDGVFSGLNVDQVILPEGLLEIGSQAFSNCNSLTTIDVPESVTSIESGAFRYCDNLTYVSLPNHIRGLYWQFFDGCIKLRDFVIPDSVTVIENYAFWRCESLTSIVIPEKVKAIGGSAFEDCYGMESITVLAVQPPSGGESMFHYTNDCPIYVPAASLNAYKTSQYWSEYADRILPIAGDTIVIEPEVPDTIIVEPDMEMYFYMPTVECEAGNRILVPVFIKNDKPVVGFSLDVYVPAGLSFFDAVLEEDRTNGHALEYSVDGKYVSLICLSNDNSALIGSDGAVLNLIIDVPESAGIADTIYPYYLGLLDAEITVSAFDYYNPADTCGIINVSLPPRYTPGDVNDDERISVTDAVGIINFIIKGNTQGLNYRAADANEDGVIDAADVVTVVNKILNKRKAAPARDAASVRTINSRLTMDAVEVGRTFQLPVLLEGMQNEITAIQFNLSLPENLKLNGITTDNSHMTAFSEQPDGTYKVVCVSLSGKTFVGNGESALTFQLETDSRFNGGLVTLTDGLLVTPDGKKAYNESVILSLGDGLTGINGIDADDKADMYDLQGRSIDRANGIYIRDGRKLIQAK